MSAETGRSAQVSAQDLGWDLEERTVGHVLHNAARSFGTGEFLRDTSESISFLQAWELTGRLAKLLSSAGAQPGERVALMLPNSIRWPLLWLAILRTGAVAVPVNYAYRQDDLEFVLRDSGARVVLTTPEKRELVDAAKHQCAALDRVITGDDLFENVASGDAAFDDVPQEATRLANLQYTSGTTGFPKACMLSHDYWVWMGRLVATDVSAGRDDVTITAQPFSYIDPQWNTMLALTAGAPLVVLPRFSASGFWPAVREHQVSFFYVLGTMPMLLFKQPPNPDDKNNRVRLVMCSGINPELHRAMEDRWGAPWREAYGLTETGVDLTVPPEADELTGSGSIGYPVATKQVEIRDEDDQPVHDGTSGEIVVRGIPMMDGYWNHPEATGAALVDGWFHTGDLGVREADGRFRLVGRLKDMVRRGGENISAAEVEDVIGQHSKVLSTAVVPVPDDLWGEEVKAFVRLRGGRIGTAPDARELFEFAHERLARFKMPRYIHFVAEFPMTPSERVSKPRLIEQSKDRTDALFDMQRPGATAASQISPDGKER